MGSQLGGIDPVLIGGLVGAIGGVVILLLLAAGRSTRDRAIFRSPMNVYGTVQGWAAHFGYERVPSATSLHLRRGKGFWGASVHIDIENRGGEYKRESWILVNALVRKRDMALAAPGFLAAVPRRKGLREVNQLLASLGQPPIVKR